MKGFNVSQQAFWMRHGAKLVIARIRQHWMDCVADKDGLTHTGGIAELRWIADEVERDMKITIDSDDFLALYTGSAVLSDGAAPVIRHLQQELGRAGDTLHMAATLLKEKGATTAASEAYQAGSLAKALAAASSEALSQGLPGDGSILHTT